MKAAFTAALTAVFLQGMAAAQSPAVGTVEGTVTNAIHGEPILKAVVTVRGTQPGAQAETYVTETGTGGRFAIAGVAPGEYRVSASREGFEFRRPAGPPPAKDPSRFTVAAGQKLAGIAVRLTPVGVLTGLVLDEDGEPIARARVEAMQYVYVASGKRQLQPRGRTSVTDDRGVYRIFDVPAGVYYLRASGQNERFDVAYMNGENRAAGPALGYVATYYPSARDAAQASRVSLTAGAELSGLDIRLLQVTIYSIRGTVPGLDPAKPYSNFQIMAQARDDVPPLYRTRGARVNGNAFEISGLEPGTYIVTATMADRAKPNEPSFAREIVDVAGRDVEGVELRFTPGVDVSGVVKTAGPAEISLENVRVLLQADDPPPRGTPTAQLQPDGTFAIHNVFPDKYRVVVNVPRAYVKSVLVGDHAAPDRKIDAAHASNITVILGADFGQLDGTVTDEKGEPCATAVVTLIPDQSQPDWTERARNVSTNAKGAFHIPNVVPGEYKVYAWQNIEPGAPMDAEFRKPFEGRGAAVKVEPNGQATAQLRVIDASAQSR